MPVYIIDNVRTPIITPHRSLKNSTAVDLTTIVIKALVARHKLENNIIDEVVVGNVVSSGLGQNLARQATIQAGLSQETPAYVVNNVCGSGLQAMISCAQSIKSSDTDLVMSVGVESTTQSPFLITREKVNELSKEYLTDSAYCDGLYCFMTQKNMGQLVEDLALKHHISREDQDIFSLKSHQKACHAQEEHFFDEEIIAVETQEKKVVKDDRPRENISLEMLSKLSPAFKAGGSLTAGNSCAPCDAAAGILLSSERYIKKYLLKPKARIIDYVSVAVSPADTFEAGSVAVKEVLKKAKISLADIDLFEICESFAAQAILVQRQLKIPSEKMNIYGGDVALGHPLGAAGLRILVTLINALKREKKRLGLACVSFGSGGAIAVIIEKL